MLLASQACRRVSLPPMAAIHQAARRSPLAGVAALAVRQAHCRGRHEKPDGCLRRILTVHESLKAHYERKYAADAQSHGVRSIVPTKRPLDRFEAAVSAFASHFSGGSVLELGAGDGSVAKSLLRLCSGIERYVLGDISMPRVQGIRSNLADPRVQVLQLDAERVGTGVVDRFDAVIMIALIEHLVDPLRAMQGIRQLLRPGGFVYVDTPNIAKYTRRVQLLRGRFPATASKNEGLTTYWNQPVDLHDEGHLHYFTFRSLSRMLLDRCGFARIVKNPYACGNLALGKHLESQLATVWPEMFSELAVFAFAE